MTSLPKTPAPLFASSSGAAKNSLRENSLENLPAQRVRGVLQHWPALVSACGGDPKLAADFLVQDMNQGLLFGLAPGRRLFQPAHAAWPDSAFLPPPRRWRKNLKTAR